MKIKKAIILAAGYGKRMLPITNRIPRPLVKINGITLLEKSINFLSSLGINHIIINTHHLNKQIVKFINTKNFPPKISVIIEKKKF